MYAPYDGMTEDEWFSVNDLRVYEVIDQAGDTYLIQKLSNSLKIGFEIVCVL